MIHRRLLKDQRPSPYTQWVLAIGQFSFVAGILLSRFGQTELTALLSGLLLGVSIVLNLTWLYLRRIGQHGGGI